MSRPFFNYSIAQLEEAFAERQSDPEFLAALRTELTFRKTDRAAKLQVKLDALTVRPASSVSPSAPSHRASTHTVSSPAVTPVTSTPPRNTPLPTVPVVRSIPPVTNHPANILAAWTALEVLSPPAFRRPEQLAAYADPRAVASLEGRTLPWENGGERAKPKTKLYYQVVLGTMPVETAVARLLALYADSRMDRPPTRGEAILAVVILDQEGIPVEDETGVAVASFGWGVPRALRSDLTSLANWRQAERALNQGLREQLTPMGKSGVPLTRARLQQAFDWLLATLELPTELVSSPRFAIRDYQFFGFTDAPDPLLLNSFYLGDLAWAQTLAAGQHMPGNLARYLGLRAPATRTNLLADTTALSRAVAPENIPLARWPGPNRPSLVLLQQAAVNLAAQELKTDGILAVNGPPGTGKTTLLRDLVAHLVVSRAEAMLAFKDPATAFTATTQRHRSGGSQFTLHRVEPGLRGFEMLVASSNNRAVENISAELPGQKAWAQDFADFRYFRTLSDTLFGENKTWGLIAAVLGKRANLSTFRKTFWYDEEVGFSTYLAEATGTPQRIEFLDPATNQRAARIPRIIQEEKPPRNHTEALQRWRAAADQFRTALDRSRSALHTLAQARSAVEGRAALQQTCRDLESRVPAVQAAERAAAARLNETDTAETAATTAATQAAMAVQQHQSSRPGFFARFFQTEIAKIWQQENQRRFADQKATEATQRQAATAAAHAQRAYETTLRQFTETRDARDCALANLHEADRTIAATQARLGSRFVDARFFNRDHATLHCDVPWLDDATQRLRDDVFLAALSLHRAFIDAAAVPLRHNLGVLMSVIASGGFSVSEKQALLGDLWSSLFLVVPLVSTTFASIERMLGGLPPASLGWLLIDEAGQALPQAAVGALVRCQRAVVVGDPIQIEPVVTLPETLTQTLCRHFGVDPSRFNAPQGSVQTLADAATPYYAEFHGRSHLRSVGVPLLVHRRCEDPMFTIANRIAYDGLMVDAKASRTSAIRDLLGPSTWYHVEGDGFDKWCAQEGQMLLGFLHQLAAARIQPDFYVVTPFVVVAENLRRVIRDSGVLNGWVEGETWLWLSERVGTVHTVQGREAEAVFFVLGAPLVEQNGARQWAGGEPNLLNVAITRAQEVLYVIGNRELWRSAGCFTVLHDGFRS